MIEFLELGDKFEALDTVDETETVLHERADSIQITLERDRATIPTEVIELIAEHNLEIAARSVEVVRGREPVVQFVVIA